ncbi:hypothetical protein DEAC_c12490 [Desulfosporosinus acididurans]|uniref:Uncharacterized protein n=1 Tax=Desulfosporosinus acididurans TaxID=476652 RepID=A0A0J1FUB5_9FIRM|nr:hypothetical protein [Desulfosporosinus acididurans]KLU66583.1 hypothetical protein DEAC_c12490 [Desulfosporosinus acididurans]
MGNTVTLSEIFTTEFMKLYTQFESIEELFSAGGFNVTTEEDYDAIPDKTIDTFVANTTNFPTWKEMLTEAADNYLRRP